MDGCICFTRKIQHGGDWERSRPQGPKNVHNFLMTVRPLSWACGHGTKILLILKKLFLIWLLPDISRYDSPKKCPMVLYAVNLWLKPVSATGATLSSPCGHYEIVLWSRYGCHGQCEGTCAIMIRLHHANIRTFTITALFIILDTCTIWMPQNVIIIKPAIRTLSSQVISCSHANRLASVKSRVGMRLCRWQLELIIHRLKIRFLWFI